MTPTTRSSSRRLDVRPLSVLVADDNSVNRRVAEFTLRKLGHHVTAVCDGHQAVDTWAGGAYDVILMDCQMPVMDGFDATVEIRRREPAGRRIPIVAITASDVEDDFERCRAAGMDGYGRKPMAPAELSAILAKAITGALELRSIEPVAETTNESIHSQTIAALRDLAEPGEPDPFPEIARRFLQNASSRLARLRASGGARVRIEAHSLRGMSGTIGAMRLASLCGDLEHLASHDAEAAAARVQLVHDEFVCVQRALEIEIERSAEAMAR